MKKIKMSILLAMVVFLLAVTNASAAWYGAKITNVTPRPDGTVSLKFSNGTGETACTESNGVCRAQINANDLGAKNMLATVLTAVSLNSEVTLSLASPPSYVFQDVNGISLDAQ
jgi:hypothetical protein